MPVMLHSRLQDPELEIDAVRESLEAEKDFAGCGGAVDAWGVLVVRKWE